ncbi:MAG: polyprenyl glycosylphosphotransferase [Altererythrobacter sp.]|nr:polyprenyl glycosylphosphotransferase [Altererythrobacter sp.]
MDVSFPRNFIFLRRGYQASLVSASIIVQTIILIYLPIAQPSNLEITAFTGLGCLLASLSGTVLIKSLGRYPGVEESSYTFPSLAVCYGILLLILLMMRLPYSRLLIASTFAINLLLLSVLYAVLRKSAKLCIGVVPEGYFQDLTAIPNVKWRVLQSPEVDCHGIDAISVDLSGNLSSEWERRLAAFALEGVPVYDLKHLRESITGKVQIKHLSENSLGTLSPLYAWMTVKHVTDWVLALVAIVLLCPLLAVLALLIRLTSPGPAIFRQTRVGYRGKPFEVFKLRTMTTTPRSDTMRPESSDRLEAAVTKDNDVRITPVGRFLRQTRLDELPQLLNVLKGEMSWIGPRPEALVLSQWYEREIPFYPYRHIVRPGITGWAQVHQGHVANVEDVTEKLHFDFYYIKHYSFWIDLIVVGRTIKTMLTGFGAR